MKKKAITNIYETLIVFILISGLIIFSTNLENKKIINNYKISEENKIKEICNTLYESGIFYESNSSVIQKQTKQYLNEFEIGLKIINLTDNSIISYFDNCQNKQDKYAINYLIGYKYENNTIIGPRKIIIFIC